MASGPTPAFAGSGAAEPAGRSGARSRGSAARIAVVHLSASGHIRPLLPLVAALQAAGAQTVQWALPRWEGECEIAGSEFRALPDAGVDFEHPSSNMVGVAALIAEGAERLAPWLAEDFRAAGVDVVLRDSLAQYGRFAALENNLPQIVFSAAMAFPRGILRSLRLSPAATLRNLPLALRQNALGTRELAQLGAIRRRVRRRYGVAMGPWLEVLSGRYDSPTLIGTSPGMQMLSETLRGEDIRFVGPLRAATDSPAADEPALAGLEAEEELIYVSLGTLFEQRADFFRQAAEALAAPGRRVVLSIGRIAPESLGNLPDGVSVHAHVDQLALLARADLFVTHGGFNSLQEALVAGVPMLFHPQMPEQALNADRACQLGAGLRLRRPSATDIAALTAQLLRDRSYRQAAARLGAELRRAVDIGGAVDAVLAAAPAQ